MARTTSYVFTHNNYSAATLEHYGSIASDESCVYLVYGKEVAPTTGTPHLQGYVQFSVRKRINVVRRLFPGAHLELARGTPEQCRNYCIKDGDFTEFGDFDSCVSQGKRTDIDAYRDWLTEQTEYPSNADIASQWTNLYVRYATRLLELRDFIFPNPVLETSDYRFGWQANLAATLAQPPVNDRKIKFIVDRTGGAGKTWFIRKYLTDNNDGMFLSIGKRDDLAYAIDRTKRVFLINVPRNQMHYLQYGILESVKDRLVFSTKYMSVTKRMLYPTHVVVFSNEMPDMSALSADRFDILELS